MMKETTTIRLDPEVKSAMQAAAKKQGRTLSSLMNYVASEWLAQQEKPRHAVRRDKQG